MQIFDEICANSRLLATISALMARRHKDAPATGVPWFLLKHLTLYLC